MATLTQSVVNVSNGARDVLLQGIDPAAFQAAPPPVVGAGAGPPPPPPPPGGAPARLLRPDLYKDTFFNNLSQILTEPEQVLETKTKVDNLDYAGWFNYFLAEAKRSAQPEPLGRILCVLFDLNALLERNGNSLRKRADFTFPAAMSPEFQGLIDRAPKRVPLGILTYLLEEGFESFPTVSASGGGVDTGGDGDGDPKVTHVFGPYFDLKSATSTEASKRDTWKEYLLFYRGDMRPPNLVVQHAGASCRADLAHWQASANVHASWHPWKSSRKRNKMWVRKGNADNDYFTVNSIAMDFHIACAYPMLKLGEIDSQLTGHITDWSKAERTRLRKTGTADYCYMKRCGSHQAEYVLCDRTRVYVCVFHEDTQLSPTYTNNSYPEMGVRNVDLTQIIAWFEIDRHHNNDSIRSRGGPRSKASYESTAVGSTMTIRIARWGWMNGPEGVKNTLGIHDPSAFEQKLNSLTGKVFEIDHSRLRSDMTFDVSSRKADNPYCPPRQ